MRKPRIIVSNAMYHVVARTNRGEHMLSTDTMKQLIYLVIKRAKKKYSFTLANFCLMGNHIHFMITPAPGENLSRIMQWILSVFALRFNTIFGLKGHVWYDRFKSKVIEDLRQFLNTFIYIVENPVRAGIVKHPHDYRFNAVTFLRRGLTSVADDPGEAVRLQLPGCCGLLLLVAAE